MFIPNNLKIDTNEDICEWLNKYFLSQIRMVQICKYWFDDNINVRIYLDHYSLERLKLKQMNVSDIEYLKKLSNNFKDIYDLQAEPTNMRELRQKLQEVYDELILLIRQKENLYTFCVNALDRFGFDDIFSYRIKNSLYLEYKNKKVLGHKTNGYIGQYIRYIAVRQRTYSYKSETIQRPTNLLFRDAHTRVPGFLDQQMIRKFYDATKEKEAIVNVISTYSQSWHPMFRCYNQESRNAGIYAGFLQLINTTKTEMWITEKTYWDTYGLIFDYKNAEQPEQPKIIQTRNQDFYTNKGDYEYGIDEYTLSSFFLRDNNFNNIYEQDDFFIEGDDMDYEMELSKDNILPSIFWENIVTRLNIYTNICTQILKPIRLMM